MRNEECIIEALKNTNQYIEGLKCEIYSVEANTDNSSVTVELQLSNNDAFAYFYLDPDKIGTAMFQLYQWIVFTGYG